jgi:hypothetical protein
MLPNDKRHLTQHLCRSHHIGAAFLHDTLGISFRYAVHADYRFFSSFPPRSASHLCPVVPCQQLSASASLLRIIDAIGIEARGAAAAVCIESFAGVHSLFAFYHTVLGMLTSS